MRSPASRRAFVGTLCAVRQPFEFISCSFAMRCAWTGSIVGRPEGRKSSRAHGFSYLEDVGHGNPNASKILVVRVAQDLHPLSIEPKACVR